MILQLKSEIIRLKGRKGVIPERIRLCIFLSVFFHRLR